MVGVSASGSTLRWMIAGRPDFRASSNAGRKSAVVSDRSAVAAEGPRISGEIRILQGGRHHAARVVALLVHADGSVHAVVHDHDDHRKLVLHCGGEFLPSHQEVAVASECDDDACRGQALHSDRGRHPVTHRARDRRELRAVATIPVIAMDPDREVPRTVADHRIGRQPVAKVRDDRAEIDRARHRRGGVGPGQEIVVGDRRLASPAQLARRLEPLERGGESGWCGVDRQMCAVDAAELLDAGKNVHQGLPRPGNVDQRVALRGHFPEPPPTRRMRSAPFTRAVSLGLGPMPRSPA